MKKILGLPIILSVFINCRNKTENHISVNQERNIARDTITTKNINVPLGDKMLDTVSFPNQWNNLIGLDDTNPNFTIEKVSKKGYDSLFYFIEKKSDQLYNDLRINNKIKAILPQKEAGQLLKLYNNTVVLDNMYFVKTLSKNDNYSVELYKNGNKYESFIGFGEEKATFNYLCLVTVDTSRKPIDYLLIYYDNYDDILSYKRFFYIDDNFKIILKDFIVDELMTKSPNEYKMNINSRGYFNKEKYY